MRLRELNAGEEPLLLELLDGWPFRDGRRGRDFFRRYLEDDPAYEPRNVWVAESGGALVSCVQIFPRTLRSAAGALTCGGIGSVFTVPAHRRAGLASRLLEAAVDSMRARGMHVSVLLASRLAWYASLGWQEIGSPDVLLEAPGGGEVGRRFVREDLPRVSAIAAWYSRGRLGSVVRDPAGWEASLRLAGDPDEEFRVAEVEGEVVAYLRLARLDGAWRALEWGRTERGAPALAGLLVACTSAGLVLPPVGDDALVAEVEACGGRLRELPGETSWMVRPVCADAVATRAALPGDRFAFWPADRF